MWINSVSQATLTAYAVLGLLAIRRAYRRSGLEWGAWVLYGVQRLYGGLMFHWRANRRCPFPAEGPAIILANHRSPTDPLMIWMNNHLRPQGVGRPRVIGFLMAREYYEMPALNWICRKMQSIPADRNGQDVAPAREALSRLRAGRLVGIFPEGHLNSGEGLLPFGPGAAWLALRAEAPVYPVFIQGPTARNHMIAPFLKRSRVRVLYGRPLDLSPWKARKRSGELIAEVTAFLRQELARLGGIRLEARELPAIGASGDEVRSPSESTVDS